MFKSTNRVGSHCLLVATLNGEVDRFVNTYSKTKNPINYTQLAQHGVLVGGKKPSSKHKASSKKTKMWTVVYTYPPYSLGVMHLTCACHHCHQQQLA